MLALAGILFSWVAVWALAEAPIWIVAAAIIAAAMVS